MDRSYIAVAICASRQEPQSLGPYSIQRELSLARPVGLDIWRPPTFVGTQDRKPPSVAADRTLYVVLLRLDIANGAQLSLLVQTPGCSHSGEYLSVTRVSHPLDGGRQNSYGNQTDNIPSAISNEISLKINQIFFHVIDELLSHCWQYVVRYAEADGL